MRKYIIMAESGADLSQDLIEQHHIHIALMHVTVGNSDYTDGSITMEELCGYYDRTKNVPKTSAASPYDYQQVYEKVRTEHPDAIIIHVCYSMVLSATFQNSQIAEFDESRIYHIDSKNVSIGQAFIVMKTVRLIKENPDFTPEEIVKQVTEYANRTRFFAVPGNLDYIRAGGRVSNAQYLGATLLRIKPLIELIDGKMITTKKYSGSMKSIARQMLNDYFTRFDIDKSEIFLIHSYKLNEDIKTFIGKQAKEYGAQKITWLQPGAVITSHSGPGTIGIAGIEKLPFQRDY